MNVEEYLNELGGQIRDKYARGFVADEVRTHIMDQASDYEREGMDHEEALSKAVTEMGDPVSVGVELDRIHRPHMEWRILGYIFFISILSLIVQYIVNSHISMDMGGIENLTRQHLLQEIIGLVIMLVVYKIDYTILTGRSRIIGMLYLIAITIMSVFCGVYYNGAKSWIEIGSLRVSISAAMMLYLPFYAGILYEYRGRGRAAIIKIVLWMIAPVISLFISGYCTFPVIGFFIIAEMVLFVLALTKNWYKVNKKSVLFTGFGTMIIVVISGVVKIWHLDGYQNMRLKNWLAHFGIGKYASGANDTINFVNSRLSNVFAYSQLFQKSDVAINIMKEVPANRNNLILGSIAATCGLIAVIAIIVCLGVLSAYVFRISIRQKNSLGYIVGCACGISIGLQCLSNVLIVFGVLPLTNSILPFFTSGFSYMVVDYFLLGMILSIYRYKDIRIEKNADVHNRQNYEKGYN